MSKLTIEKKLVAKEAFIFIGKSVMTTNEAEMRGVGVIPTQWQNFYQNQLLESIPNKKNETILALYTEYQSDEKGPYTFAIGTKVTNLNEMPNGMKSFSIPEGRYMVFTTRKGPVNEVVIETWQYIWEWSKTNKRAFLTDFELYDERCADPDNAQVDIYISIL
ncbi:putative transcriptional regulator YdeE [Bacillus pakistanensis]|uniref:Transcriptional regulator YdeE n=1 Tax=Rossellomorea pakistanensis TaxID=992288 RepID=A0ABS2NJ66_9BACI|nr:GyrI-like domain-containing protein [Bacillus pakistanensis]MBM7587907.1 putative transcriptional regulator YdeE [Bacillus pakistanensis]